MSSLAVVTTFPPNRWTAYAKRMLESHVEFWPDDVVLYAYHEGVKPDFNHSKVKFINIEEANPELVKFKQLNIDLKNLKTGTIKEPKLQETSTFKLFQCMNKSIDEDIKYCQENTKKEIATVLNRRIVLPFYIPIIALLCSFLLIKTQKGKNYFLNKYSIFILSFLVLLYAELIIRYTGISKTINILFTVTPAILIPIIYFLLIFNMSKESAHNE